ncbi:MAG: hypothetical protein MJK18_10240 [Bdellovibrionales bacterium]|nr:hypothetical protein [Bdellovibrionales bacterium]
MRNIRRQPREEVDLNEIIKQPSKEIKPEKKKQSIISNSSNSIVAIMKLGLTANEIKLLEAIESEKIAENENIPAMSTNYICSKYKINHKYLGDAIKGLIEKGLIKRHPATFRGQKSFAWEVLKQ